MKRQTFCPYFASLYVSLSGCIGENEVSSTDDGPSWINETGTTDQHWAIQLDDDEWLEVKSAIVIIDYYRESGNVLTISLIQFKNLMDGQYLDILLFLEGVILVVILILNCMNA